jgi:hypothetical protein
MAQANDAQMQQYANERIRVRAEQFRALINACRDDKAAIDDVYDRAANGAAWADDRTDGPPQLLVSQDFLTFNAFITNFLTAVDSGALSGDRDQFLAACVRPVNQ